jgi:hypothetical protein
MGLRFVLSQYVQQNANDLHRAEFFPNDVRDATADQSGGGGPVMQAQDDTGDGAGDACDFDDHADAFEMRIRGHGGSFRCFAPSTFVQGRSTLRPMSARLKNSRMIFCCAAAMQDGKDKNKFRAKFLRPGKLGRSGLRPYMTEARHMRSRCWRD